MAGGSPSTDFLSQLLPEERRELTELAGSRRFERGATLLHEGQVGERVMVLVSGRVKVGYLTPDGKEVVLGFCGPGDLLGELAVIDGRPRSSTVTAIEPVEALAIPARDFMSFLDRTPRVTLLMLRLLTRRFRDADLKRIQFGASDTVGRVSARLVELAERYGEPSDAGTRIALPLSQEELAGWSGASREAVAKALQTLRGLGWITTERRRITVLDLERLRERAA